MYVLRRIRELTVLRRHLSHIVITDLLHSPIEGTARWIPFSNDPDGSDATIKNPQTRNDTDMPDYALKAAPKAYMFALRDKATRAINPDLAWLRNRRILLLGCSLDRYFLYSFCETHQGEMTNPGNWQGLFACTIPVGVREQGWVLSTRRCEQVVEMTEGS